MMWGRIVRAFIIISLLAVFYSVNVLAEELIINTAHKTVAFMGSNFTRADLVKRNLPFKDQVVDMEEGSYCDTVTVLWPGTKREITLYWNDDSSENNLSVAQRRKLENDCLEWTRPAGKTFPPPVLPPIGAKAKLYAVHMHNATEWSVDHKLHIGSTLLEVESVYGPVKFRRLGSDIGGFVFEGKSLPKELGLVLYVKKGTDPAIEKSISEPDNSDILSSDLSEAAKKQVVISEINYDLRASK